MREEIKKVMAGAAAGAAGTALLQGVLAGSQRFAPNTLPPIERDPGEFMLQKASEALPQRFRNNLPAKAAKAVASSLGFGYGTTFGLLYSALCLRRKPKKVTRILTEGSALGIASWAVGFLGWLPATKLMRPVWKHQPKQVASSILSHVLFGIAVAGVFKSLAKRPEPRLWHRLRGAVFSTRHRRSLFR
jgi:hypothetical protein